MTKIFIGGSRSVTKLTKAIKDRTDEILSRRNTVLIGDANGADKAMQHYFSEKRYQDVIVFCAGYSCRNNLGDWKVQYVEVDGNPKGFAFYAAKDVAMCREADAGLMLWDGKSSGTLNNILNLLEHNKKVTVYLAKRKLFISINSMRDLMHLLKNCESTDMAKFESKLRLRERLSVQQDLSLAFNL